MKTAEQKAKIAEAGRLYRLLHSERIRECKKKWRAANAEKLKAKRKANRDKLRLDAIKWRRNNPDKLREIYKRNRVKYRQKYIAHTAIRNAVSRGKIIKPLACEECQKPCAVQGHHEDYSKPMEVIWLCRACHNARHGYVGQYVEPPAAERRDHAEG